jgi:hypothetical protein
VSQVLFWRRSAAHEAKSPDRPKRLPGQQSRLLRYPPAISCRNFRILPTNSLLGLKQGISSPEKGNTLPKNDYPPAILFLVSAPRYFYNNISQHFVNFRLILQRTQGASFSGCMKIWDRAGCKAAIIAHSAACMRSGRIASVALI